MLQGSSQPLKRQEPWCSGSPVWPKFTRYNMQKYNSLKPVA
jgi:hypothetical protein